MTKGRQGNQELQSSINSTRKASEQLCGTHTEMGHIHWLILTQLLTSSITFAPSSNVYMQFGKLMFAVFSTALYQQLPKKKAHTGRGASDSTQILLKFNSGRDTCYCR